MKKPIKKAQAGKSVKATADSTDYFRKIYESHSKQAETSAKYGLKDASERNRSIAKKALKDEVRQKVKGKPGYDESGYPLNKFKPKSPKQQISEGVKKKMKSGGVVKSKKK